MLDIANIKIRVTVYDSDQALQSYESYTLPNTPFYFSLMWGDEELKNYYTTKEIIWHFGDGETAIGPKVSHFYKWPGTYNVKAILTDIGGNPVTINLEKTLTVKNVMPDIVSFENIQDSKNIIYKVPAGKRTKSLKLYRYNSWQNDKVFSDNNYTINLFASGGKSNYISVSSYYESKWSHLKPYFGFIQYQIGENNLIKPRIIDSTITTSTSVYAEKYFDATANIEKRWNINLRFYPYYKSGTEFCGTSGEIPNDRTIHFIDQKPCTNNPTDVVFLYAYPDTRHLADNDTLKYQFKLDSLPNGFINYPWNTQVVKTTFNSASTLKFSSNGITVDGPSIVIGPLTGQNLYSFDIFPIKWATSKIPFVITFVDNENYVVKNYPQIKSYTTNPSSPSILNSINVFLMEWPNKVSSENSSVSSINTPSVVKTEDYVILNSEEVPNFENGCYFAGVLSANREINFAYLSAIALIKDKAPDFDYPGFVYIFQPGVNAFRRYERSYIFDHSNEEKLQIKYKDILTSFSYPGSGGVNITYAPLRTYKVDTKDYVWVTDADKDNIYVFDQDGAPIANGYESNRIFAGYTNKINTGKFKFIRPGKLSPEPGFVNARGLPNADKISSSPCQVAITKEGHAWITLYDSISSFRFNKDNFYATALALPDVRNPYTRVITEFIDTEFNAAYNEYINQSTLPYTRALTYAQSGAQNFVNIIRNGPFPVSKTYPYGPTNSDREYLQSYFYNNRSLVQDKIIKYINSTFVGILTSSTLSGKCYRDSGWITDAIAADIANNANHRSIDVGLIYFSGPTYESTGGGAVPTLPDNQIFATAASISSIGPIMAGMLPYGYYSQDEQFLLSGFNTISNIVSDKNKTPKTSPRGQITDSTLLSAADDILKQKAAIQQKTIEFVKTYYPSALSGTIAGSSEALSAKCFRDTGYIVESMAADIANNANHRSVETGLFYISGAVLGPALTNTNIPTLPSNQIEGTVAAISAIGSFITGLLTPATYTYSSFGALSSSSYYTSSQNKLISGFNNFIKIINDKNQTPATTPSGTVPNSNWYAAANIILQNKEAIQLRTVEYVKENFPFALSATELTASNALSAKCYRDTGFIVDSLIADITNNANHRSVETGVFYFSGAVLARAFNINTSVPTLPEDQVTATIAAISAIGSFITGLEMPVEGNPTTAGILSGNQFLTKEQISLVNLIDTFSQTVCSLPPSLPPLPYPDPIIPDPYPPIDDVGGEIITSYTTFGGPTPVYIPLIYAYEGRNVALLLSEDYFNRTYYQRIANIVNTFDNAYDQYAFYTGREPARNAPTTFNNKSTIARVAVTCGSSCGLVGYTGIEVTNAYWDTYYANNLITLDNHLYDQVLFYELGRNFWFYGDQLSSATLPFMDGAFAAFMRFISMEKAGVSGAPYNGIYDFEYFKTTIVNMLSTYTDGPYNWDNTFKVDTGVPNPLGLTGAADLMASVCFNLRARFGDAWLNNIWKFVGKRPAATTDQDIVDNFIIASSEAVNLNLISLFQNVYRWPISQYAIDYLQYLPLSRAYTVEPVVYPITESRSQSKYTIQRYRSEIQQQVVEYVRSAFPYALSGATAGSSEALSAKCFRDTGYVVDAICDDLFGGVNYRSIETGTFYFSGAVLARQENINSPVPTLPQDQVTATIAAITAIGSYITGIDMPDVPAPFTSTGVLSTYITQSQKLSVLNLIDVLTYPLKNSGGQRAFYPPLSSSQDEKALASIIRNNKTNIQRAVSAYVYEKQYLTFNPSLSAEITAKCNRDVGYMVDAVASDLETGSNAKTITYAIAYWDGSSSRLPETSIPNQKANTVDTINKLKSSILNVAVLNLTAGNNLILKKVKKLIDVTVYPLINNGNSVSYSPSGSPTQKDINLGNLILENKSTIQEYVSAYVLKKNYLTINNSTSAYLYSKCNRDVGYMIDAVSSDLKNGVNSKSIQYGLAYWDGSTSRLPEDSIPEQKNKTIDTIKILQSKALDIAIENSDSDENLALKKIKSLVNTVVYPIKTAGGSLQYDPPGLPLTTKRQEIVNLLLENKTTLQSKVSAYVTRNGYLTAGTVYSEKCTRDAGFMIDAVASDIYNGVLAKSVQYGLAYWDGSTSRLPENIISNQKVKTIDTIEFLRNSCIELYVSRLSASTQVVNDLFRLSKTVAYPLLNSGAQLNYSPAGEKLTDARLDAYNRLIKNRSKIQAAVKGFVDSNVALTELQSFKCNRDVGLMVDAIANDIYSGVSSRSIQYALAYWEGSVSRLTSAVPDQNEITAQTVLYLYNVLTSFINERFYYPDNNRELYGGAGSDYNLFNGFAGENTILPTAVDVDRNDNVYIAYSHPLNSFVMKYDSNGNQTLMIVFPKFTTPQQVLIDANDNLWVSVLNVRSIEDEQDPQISQMPAYINNRNDYIYFYGANNGKSFKVEYPLVGDLTMDRDGNVWFNSGINELTVINSDNNPKSYVLGNPASNLSYTQDFGGIAGDINGFLWVINNAESKLQIFETDNPTSKTGSETVGFALPSVNDQLPPENQFSYYLTTGDFAGIRWLLKNKPEWTSTSRTIDGASNIFSIKKPSPFIVKKNENYDLNEKIKSFVQQEKLRESDILFNEFTNAIFNGDNVITNELGKVIYERIANYVDNHSDLDLCTLQSLESLYMQLGFTLEKFFNTLPVNVRRVFDILTINHKKLFGTTNTFNRNFILSSYWYDKKNNLGRELSIMDDTFIAGNPIVAYEYFSGKYSLVVNTMVPEKGVVYSKPYPLSGVKYDWGWGLVLGSRDQTGEEVAKYYKFYEYKPSNRNDEIYDNLIDFNDNLTSLTIYNSSYNDWTRFGGYMDTAISSMLYEGLNLY